jgi:hypothetical protein
MAAKLSAWHTARHAARHAAMRRQRNMRRHAICAMAGSMRGRRARSCLARLAGSSSEG